MKSLIQVNLKEHPMAGWETTDESFEAATGSTPEEMSKPLAKTPQKVKEPPPPPKLDISEDDLDEIDDI
jgi:hypothetical protein